MSVSAIMSERKAVNIAPVLFLLFVFFIPISPTLKSIFFTASILSILFISDYSRYIPFTMNTLWGRSALIFLVYILIATLWSPAPYAQQLIVLGKYCKLIYLPVLAVGFINRKVRFMSFNAYLAAMLVTCIVSIFKSHGIFLSGDPGAIFYNHIITGFMMAFAAYLACYLAFQYDGWKRCVYVAVGLLMSYQVLFINTGRTGYIIYFILMSFLFIQKLTLKQAVAGILAFSALFALVYNESTIMQSRSHDLLSDINALHHHNQNTSLGYRMQFHDYARSLWLKHPLTGIGTGGFKYTFEQDNPIPVWGKVLTDPHSQYWMTLSEHGVIGLVLLFVFLGGLLISSFKLTETRPILLGILIAFCIGSVSDSILCYSTAGYLLVVMSAICFGELVEKHARNLEKKRSTDALDAIPA